MSFHYYGLLSSLPPLSIDFSLSRVPISRNALKARLSGLSFEDFTQIHAVIDFHQSLYSITRYTDLEVVKLIQTAFDQIRHPGIEQIFLMDISILTLMTSLRQRILHRDPVLPNVTPHSQPRLTQIINLTSGGSFSLAQLTTHIRRYWTDPYFNLAWRFRWLPEFLGYLEQGQVLAAERCIDRERWTFATGISQQDPFSLEAIAAYLAKWDILYRWSQVDEQQGQQRFDTLVEEILENA